MTAIGLDELLALETMVWQALVAGDAQADGALLAEGFLGVYPSGFANRQDHRDQLVDGPSIATFELSDARSFAVADDAVMLAYRADFRRPPAGPGVDAEAVSDERMGTGTGAAVEVMYVSSLWVERDGVWINLFSQDTPAG